MQNASSDIQQKIKMLCLDRAESSGDFIEFTNALRSLDVIRQTYDLLENSLYFYSKDAMLYRLPISEMEKSNVTKLVIGDTLDVAMVQSAIENFDEKNIGL